MKTVAASTSKAISKKTIPAIWKRTAGMFRGIKKVDALRFQKTIRGEWSK